MTCIIKRTQKYAVAAEPAELAIDIVQLRNVLRRERDTFALVCS
jgi:hypothetical protein